MTEQSEKLLEARKLCREITKMAKQVGMEFKPDKNKIKSWGRAALKSSGGE